MTADIDYLVKVPNPRAEFYLNFNQKNVLALSRASHIAQSFGQP